MKPLSVCVALLGLLALVQPIIQSDLEAALLGLVILICAATTYRSAGISSFLKIFVGVFSVEAIVSGLVLIAGRAGLWPDGYTQYLPPTSLPMTVAIFSILVYAIARLRSVKQLMRIADRYIDADDKTDTLVWRLPRFMLVERRGAIAMGVCLGLIGQAEVAINLRINFFNRDWFDAIQNRDATAFWQGLLFVFVPWAFAYVAAAVLEFFMQSLLIIRWRG